LDTSSKSVLDKSYIFDSNESSVQYAQDWSKEFAPKLVRTSSDGKVHVDTKFSRLLGKPPLMVAGMTPTSVNETFVSGARLTCLLFHVSPVLTLSLPFFSACINAGYHCELAGGGHYNEAAFRSRVDKIMEQISPGESVTVNIMFLNAGQWGFQYPLVQVMRKEVCIYLTMITPSF